MKNIFVYSIISIVLFACNSKPENNTNTKLLEDKIQNLQNQIDHNYKPSLGENMLDLQIHHSKLWFAGTNANWKLADFEILKIKEALENIQKFNSERTETQNLPMIFGSIDSVKNAISKQNVEQFKSNYVILTNTCNTCHQVTNHEYNIIKTPENPPFSNQLFGKEITK